MTSDLDNTRDPAGSKDISFGDRARNRAYHREFWPGMVGYVVVLFAVIAWGDLEGTSPWRYVLALLPMVPLAFVVRAVMKHLHRVDDYQRRLTHQGLAVGFLVAMTASLTIGFLGFAGLQVPAAGWIIWSLGMVGWATSPLTTRAWAK
jgi:hypothetical protein